MPKSNFNFTNSKNTSTSLQIKMNKSAATTPTGALINLKPVSVESPESGTSTIISLSSEENYNDQPEETQESSWATYIDNFDHQQKKLSASDSSFNDEKETDCNDEELSYFAKKLRDYNNMLIEMKKAALVEVELDDTACSPHSSPTVMMQGEALTEKQLEKRELCISRVVD